MKTKNEYVAPQITAMALNTADITTVSFDKEDNWDYDVFGIEMQ